MIGCLCIHGFTGSPYEVEPLVEYLMEAHPDWKFRVPTLPGHGETLSLRGVIFQEWIDHAESEYLELAATCETIYVIGFSMGGMISSYIAANHKVDKLVLLSAAAYYLNPKQMALEIKEFARDLVNGNLAENELFLRYKQKITQTPLSAAIQFQRLVSYVRPQLGLIEVPTLIAQGESDGLVPPKSAEYLYETIPAKQKRLTYIKGSAHHICHCQERVALFSEVETFLQEMPEMSLSN
ncbi:carboxylesterase [Bacillus sp. FJAT-27225]|uniref:alpha/beta hydrolase n=1 Tax=Bacillus sp. FJAT-27225 TaxID=1743144 RepID=UPI00080C223F|nr:alpha/beta fold hydrolase [Bacillus sp. FJAT-27225]OCA89343.1 carboxylesterase [Bacillus sp. FJAT-27225]